MTSAMPRRSRARAGLRACHGTLAALALATGIWSCRPASDEGAPLEADAAILAALDRATAAVRERVDSIDARLLPVPLLTPQEESELRRFLNAEHLAVARRLGVPRSPDQTALDTLRRGGRLVELEDSTSQWVIRELEHSVPLTTPVVPAFLAELGDRFHARLGELGVPPFRLEVTSVLRTSAAQRALGATNPNAAEGESSHEYATTVDVSYASFAAPGGPPAEAALPEAPGLAPYMELMAVFGDEAVAARRSRELQAILGRVLAEMQNEGTVLVTLERQQPVYHLTVARSLP